MRKSRYTKRRYAGTRCTFINSKIESQLLSQDESDDISIAKNLFCQPKQMRAEIGPEKQLTSIFSVIAILTI